MPGWFKIVQPLMFRFIGRKMSTKGLANIKAKVEELRQKRGGRLGGFLG